MEEKLKRWQAESGKGESALPSDTEWFRDARAECIQAKLLTKEHSMDVARSYLKSYVKHLANYQGPLNRAKVQWAECEKCGAWRHVSPDAYIAASRGSFECGDVGIQCKMLPGDLF